MQKLVIKLTGTLQPSNKLKDCHFFMDTQYTCCYYYSSTICCIVFDEILFINNNVIKFEEDL